MRTKRRVSPSEIRVAAELATNKFQHNTPARSRKNAVRDNRRTSHMNKTTGMEHAFDVEANCCRFCRQILPTIKGDEGESTYFQTVNSQVGWSSRAALLARSLLHHTWTAEHQMQEKNPWMDLILRSSVSPMSSWSL